MLEEGRGGLGEEVDRAGGAGAGEGVLGEPASEPGPAFGRRDDERTEEAVGPVLLERDAADRRGSIMGHLRHLDPPCSREPSVPR